jgi:hypothetical protein
MHDPRQVKTRTAAAISQPPMCHYDLLQSGWAAARVSLKPPAFGRARAASPAGIAVNVDFSRAVCGRNQRGMWRCRETGEHGLDISFIRGRSE